MHLAVKKLLNKVKDVKCNVITTVKVEKNQTSFPKNTMRGLDVFMISVFSSSGFYLRSLNNEHEGKKWGLQTQ